MSTSIEATFDGSVFRPSTPVMLSPNTQVRLTVETLTVEAGAGASFLQTARAMKIEGPPDWASRFDEYLYGEDESSAR
jgi:hypothetical protein